MATQVFTLLLTILSCTLTIVADENKEQNHLIYKYHAHSQEDITKTLEKYPRLRDFHNSPARARLYTVIILCNVIAKFLNSSLIASKSKIYLQHPIYPTIAPNLMEFDLENRSAIGFWEKALHQKTSLPIILQVDSIPYNFAYCDAPSTLREKYFTSVFTEPFDSWIWMHLSISFLIVSLVLLIENKVEPMTALLATFSALLSSTTGISYGKRRSSPIFICWMFVGIVLSNVYSGIMSSYMIKPLPLDVMSKVSDLSKRNYTLVFKVQKWVEMVNATVKSLHIKSLFSLIDRAEVNESFTEWLAFGRKKAFVAGWPVALFAATRASNLITNTTKMREYGEGADVDSLSRRNCFVGKSLVSSGYMYFGFLPPNNKRVGQVFQRLFESGIYRLWMNEYYGLAYSPRLQDRVKVQDRTTLLNDNSRTDSMKFSSKLGNLFYLWGIGVIFCLAEFAREKLHKYIFYFYQIVLPWKTWRV